MVQTIRNQVKAYKVQIETNSGLKTRPDSSLLTWMPTHAAWQYARFHKRQDAGGMTQYEKVRRVP